MTEQEMRRAIGRLKSDFFAPKFEIICEIITEDKTRIGKLVDVKVDNNRKKFILHFIETETL